MTLTLERFTPHLDQTFEISGTEHTLQLTEVSALGTPTVGDRKPFSLLFKGPSGLPQGTLALRCGDFEAVVFVVPVGPTTYEAIFN